MPDVDITKPLEVGSTVYLASYDTGSVRIERKTVTAASASGRISLSELPDKRGTYFDPSKRDGLCLTYLEARTWLEREAEAAVREAEQTLAAFRLLTANVATLPKAEPEGDVLDLCIRINPQGYPVKNWTTPGEAEIAKKLAAFLDAE